MKKIFLSANLIIASMQAYAQIPGFQFARNIGGYYGAAWGNSVAFDLDNNVYTIGGFAGKVDFNPGSGTYNLTAAGGNDIFISKSDVSGNFVWARQIGGPSEDIGKSIAIDGSGNVYITGYFNGTADFDLGAGTVSLTSYGFQDVFIAKLDASGNFIWIKQLGGTSSDFANSVAVDGSGNIFTIGNFSGTGDFDPNAGTFNLTSAGNYDVFISKLDVSGNFVWAKQLGAEFGNSIAVDGAGNVFTTGYFNGSPDFDPGPGIFTLTSSGSSDTYISKLNASGNFVWAKRIGGIQNSSNLAFSIAVDGSGNVYTSGYFNNGDFDPGAGTFSLTSYGSLDVFISKLDASGNFIWAKQLGGTSADIGYSLAVDVAGNVYTTGYFYGISDFDPGTGTYNLTSAGNNDIFISKLDNAGNFLWVKQMGGISNDAGSSIVIDGSGNIYGTGTFIGTVDFDPGLGIFNIYMQGNKNANFISKFDVNGNLIWATGSGSSASPSGKSIAVDLSGNIFTAGYFYGTVDFNPGTGIFNLATAPTDTQEDIFISKSDASGNFLWAKQLGGLSLDKGNSITIDGSGNAISTGSFSETADFDPNAGTFNLTSAGSTDIFISKLDALGNFVWAKQLGGISNDDSYSIAVDGSGNVYTTGIFNGTADFDPGAGTFNLTPEGNSDIFISKLNSSGNFLWAKQFGGTLNGYGGSIAVDGSGNVYATGYFTGTADFDPGTGSFNLISTGNDDVFLLKLNASGNFVWAKQLGGTSQEQGNSIKIDGSGNVLSIGFFQGTADFDPGGAVFNLTSSGLQGIFVSKLDGSGNFVWAKQMGGTSTGNYGSSIAVDNSDNITTIGCFFGTIDFDPDLSGTYNLTSAGSSDIFISNLDANGNFVWAKKLGGTFFDQGFSIATGASGGVYTTGVFAGTVDFDPDAGIVNLTALGNPDMFVHKMSECTLPSAAITPDGPTTFCSGSSVILNAPVAANRSYQWKKGGTLISGATLSSYTATTTGNYRVIVTNTVTGCSKTTTNAAVVTVNPLPAATITPQGPTTFCAGGSVVLAANTGTGLTYKWKKGTNYISGATLSNYTATAGGNYRVQVTNGNGCSKTSALVAVSVPCKEGEVSIPSSDFNVSVFPNPANSEINIVLSSADNFEIEIANMLGERIIIEQNQNRIDISMLENGIYFIKIFQGNKFFTEKFLKQ
ncbi:MAG TPA: SBBP repeat-containing protein [Bacteroidia bacterium]|nr:SBBP repeat-containing protein [Bacteroidia bacterium]